MISCHNRLHNRLSLFVAVAGILFSIVPAACAQSYVYATGSPTFNTALPVELGYVNAGNGNLHLEIPLTAPAQRGKVPFIAKLVYDSRIWTSNSTVWSPTNVQSSGGGWRFVTSVDGGKVNYNVTNYRCPGAPGSFYIYSHFVWMAPDGTSHQFPISTETDRSSCDTTYNWGPSDTEMAEDSSGYMMAVTNATSAVIYAKDGTQVYPTFEDANGNYYTGSGTSVVDTLGRTPVTATVNGSNTTYTVTSSEGVSFSYTATFGPVSYSTAFHQSGITDSSGSFNDLTALSLPDGTNYYFGYDSYGELNSITLPTGGQITYLYTNFTDVYGNVNRWIYTRTSGGGQWTYGPAQSAGNQQLNYYKPNGDEVLYVFQMNGGAWKSTATYYSGGIQTVAATVTDSWDLSNTCSQCTGAAYVQLQTEQTTVPGPGGTNLTKQTQYVYDGTTLGNITAVKEWGFYAGTLPATPDRETDTTYLYYSNNVKDLPQVVTVKNGAGAQIAQTTYSYDGTTLTSVAGIVHHDDTNFGSNYTQRGNVTSVSRWVSGTASPVQISMTYDTTGQLRSRTDTAGNATNFSYTDSYYNDNNTNPPSTAASPSGVTNAFPTSITLPLIGSESIGYYYGTGKVAVVTDQNGASSYAHYSDPLDRPTQTMDGAGGWALTAYTTATQHDTYTGINDSSPSSGCSSCRHDQVLFDGLGRVTRSSLASDPLGQANTDTGYDSNGRVYSVSNPYRSTTDPTYGTSTLTYDGLDRLLQRSDPDGSTATTSYGPSAASSGQYCSTSTYGIGFPTLSIDEAGKQHRYWNDGFGRLTEVDEPNSSGSLSVATCYQYDALNNLISVVQQGQTRSYGYDGLSRLTSATDPESGTTTYSYLTGSAQCSGDPAAPCSRMRNGVTTTYTYDALNRPLTISYSDGTAHQTFQYDQSSLWGYTLSNPKGRLTHTSSGSGTSQRVFGYDGVGRVIQQIECIAACGTVTYSTNLGYDKAGDVTQITYPSGRVVSYGFNNAGRPSTVTFASASGQSVNYPYVTSVGYAPNGAMSGITLANGVTQTVNYNNRLEPSQISVANQLPMTLWSRSSTYTAQGVSNNGSILSITDNLNGNRTLSYSYDFLNRLASAQTQATSGTDCWGQTYSYDGYGNLTNIGYPSGYSGCSAPQLNISTDGNNHLTGLSYSGGNVTNDGAHSYQWDAENQLMSLDSTAASYLYDANTQRVQKTVGSTSTQFIVLGTQLLAENNAGDWTDYVPLNGQTIVKADSFEDRIHTQGTNCSNCGDQYSLFAFTGAADFNGYVIRSGDKMFVRQWESTTAHGGVSIGFTDNTDSSSAQDQSGYGMTNDQVQNSWHYRWFDLSSFAGKTIQQINLVTESTTGAGTWDLYYQDFVLVSADGTVRQLYSRETSVSLAVYATSGVTGATYSVDHQSNEVAVPDVTTSYYHADQIGSSRLMTNVNGYPIWQATFLPFGYEWNPQNTTNSLKFTGYKRDSEGPENDYAGFRYFSSQFGRFLSADSFIADSADPQSLNRYSYAGNDPENQVDPQGLCPAGTHAATVADATSYINTAETYKDNGLTHSSGHDMLNADGSLAGLDCTGLIMCAIAGKSYNSGPFLFDFRKNNLTTGTINQWTDPGTGAVGDIVFFAKPGHAAIVIGPGKFIGSQGSGNGKPGPREEAFGATAPYWGNPNYKGAGGPTSAPVFRRPCVPDQPQRNNGGNGGGNGVHDGGGGGNWLLYMEWWWTIFNPPHEPIM